MIGSGQKLLMARAGVKPPTPITPWGDIAITSTSFVQSSPTLTDGTNSWWPNGMFFKPDGTKMFILGWRNGTGTSDLVEFSLSTAWDISTVSYVAQVSAVTTSYGRGCPFRRDGTALFFYDNAETMRKYTLSTAWDLTTASLDSSNSTSFSTYTSSQPRNPFFSEDGKTVLIVDNNNDALYQFSLSTAWDITSGSVSYDATFSTTLYTNHPRGVFASSTGDQIFILGNEGAVYKFTTTDFDITSLVADGSYASANLQSALFMDYDNLKMYSGTSGRIASEYDITT